MIFRSVVYASKGLTSTGLFRYALPPENADLGADPIQLVGSDNDKSAFFSYGNGIPPFGNLNYDPNGTLEVDLSNATAATVADLRQAFQLQRFLERNARGGSRYIEALYHQFKVISSDARLQRPEYLGGGKSPVVISEVLQTSETTENNALGTLGGRGVSVGNSNNFKRYFEEHGWIIGIMSIMPKSSYMQGLHRQFSRSPKVPSALFSVVSDVCKTSDITTGDLPPPRYSGRCNRASEDITLN